MDDDMLSSSDSYSENREITPSVEDCGVGTLSSNGTPPSTSDRQDAAIDSGQVGETKWKADAKTFTKRHKLHMSVKAAPTKSARQMGTKPDIVTFRDRDRGKGVLRKGTRSRSTGKLFEGSKNASESSTTKHNQHQSKLSDGCLTVKKTKILTKNQNEKPTEVSMNAVRTTRTRRTSTTKPETPTKRLRAKHNKESMKSVPSEGTRRKSITKPATLTQKPGAKYSGGSTKTNRKSNPKPVTLTQKPGAKHSGGSMKTNRKSNPKPGPIQKKQQAEQTDGLMKSSLTKAIKRKSDTKPETILKKQRTQSIKVSEEGDTKITDTLMDNQTERCVKTVPATLEPLSRDQKGIPTELSVLFFGGKKTDTLRETRGDIPPWFKGQSTSHQAATSRDLFAQKYQQLDKLGEGGFGSVYAGYRKTDYFPVAIKYIPKEVKSVPLKINGLKKDIPVEALLMIQASIKKNSNGQSAVVSLLNKYDMEHEIVLVMERPVPSVDLFTYVTRCRLGTLQENEAKNIMKQLVDAAINMHAVNVFHRDLKQENILLEATSGVPRVRIIDFGCSCFASNGPYQDYNGTLCYAPPEYVLRRTYSAGPTTVWHLGALLFELMAGTKRFDTIMFLSQMLRLTRVLSEECEDFLWKCLNLDPEKRATLEQMQEHPWLI